jgi:phospholipid/cholesterol/gamma-HCH transport system substrate-binding protein
VRRLGFLSAALTVLLSGCVGSGQGRTYTATFSRAVQVFPGGDVRVLGVDVGRIVEVRIEDEGVEIEFTVDDPSVRLPADVEAAIVPASLLGERYVQLFPSYQGGPTLEEGAGIPLERTAVPAEPDELLRSLQNYLGAIDPQTVSRFVDNAARLLEGSGEELNGLIEHGAAVVETLSSKRNDLAGIIVQFERLTRALETRQEGLGRLIKSYNVVARTLTANRGSLEGSIIGLNRMATQLASLLIDHRDPLHQDIRTLTRTGRTLSRNADTFARTGHWASRLFHAAARAVDFEKNWLRLNNQGQELGGLILMRLEQRLMELCEDLGLPSCTSETYWANSVPSLFCFKAACPGKPGVERKPPEQQLTDAIQDIPRLADELIDEAERILCENAGDRENCLRRKRILRRCANAADTEGCLRRHALLLNCLKREDVQACLRRAKESDIEDIVDDLLQETVGNPEGVVP